MQIVGSFVFGYSLDSQKVKRPMRARICWVALLALTMGVWGGGYLFQRPYNRDNVKDTIIYDWTTPGYGGPLVLYMFYGFYDAAWQTCVYW